MCHNSIISSKDSKNTIGRNKFQSYFDFMKRANLWSLHKKWSFPFRTSSVNVTKSAFSWGFGHIYWGNPSWKTSFFVRFLIIKNSWTYRLILNFYFYPHAFVLYTASSLYWCIFMKAVRTFKRHQYDFFKKWNSCGQQSCCTLKCNSGRIDKRNQYPFGK